VILFVAVEEVGMPGYQVSERSEKCFAVLSAEGREGNEARRGT
jgi:hypothetical protein